VSKLGRYRCGAVSREMDDEVRGEGRGTISIDLGHRATSSGVECREVEFLA
jgi:hypothetical protein